MKILVTGGAGYIGSFMVKRLISGDFDVVVADSLERGHKASVDERATLTIGDLRDSSFVQSIFEEHKLDAVIHFAAYISMGESMEHPGMYFENNVRPVVHLLDAMHKHEVDAFVFSSTAGVYGNPEIVPIPEHHKKMPTNPYGESKLIVEQMLKWYQKIYGIHYAALRYFNAAGADPEGVIGELHTPETHIIPRIIQSALSGAEFTLFGNDYDTKDGTCVRDYIHVLDLVEAHILALEKIKKDKGGYIYNVGTGIGFSNKEIVEKVSHISGKEIHVVQKERRPGDAGVLIADPARIRHDLGFTPMHSDLDTIISTAWNFFKKHAS